MSILSDSAKTASLKNDYGTSKGSAGPSTFYLAFFTDDDMGTELTGTGGVSRIAVAASDTNFTISSGSLSNAVALNSTTSTSAWSDDANYCAMMDASTGGNAWDGAATTDAVSVDGAGTVVQVAIGAFTIAGG